MESELPSGTGLETREGSGNSAEAGGSGLSWAAGGSRAWSWTPFPVSLGIPVDVSPPAKTGEGKAGPPEWVEGPGIEMEGKPTSQYPPFEGPPGA